MKSSLAKNICIGIAVASALYAYGSNITKTIKREISENGNRIEASIDQKLKESAGCISITSLPADIQKPGIYCLSGNLDNPNEARDSITVFVNGVTIQGNSFCITGSTSPTATHSGIRAIDRMHVSVQNICIRGHKTGILIGDTRDAYAEDSGAYGITSFRTSEFISVVDSSLSRQTFQGIHARGSNIEIKGNSVEHVGGVQGENPFATGIYLSAVNCDVSSNRVFDLRPSGNGEGVGIAIYEGSGCTVTDNLIDPFRTTEHGRTFGIWSKSRKKDVAYIARNTVIDTDYAYGPFGYYKDNASVDSACAPFVNRSFNMSHTELGGWLSSENNKHVTTPNIRKCRDDIKSAIARAKSNLNKHTAYSVVLAYGEQDPKKNEASQVAWIMIAADLKHETALGIVNSSPTAGRRQDIYEKARLIYKAMKSERAFSSM
ncbi:UNVERIFIED_ORG: hypothetical protein J2Y77_000002 [Pseudomonas lini]